MSIARALLLRASRSQWLAGQFRRRGFARRAVRRFMPGEDVSDALDAAQRFAAGNIGTVFTQLGERVSRPEEADGVRDHYLWLLDEIAARRLPAEISVKLTHLGLDLDRESCLGRLRSLAARAAQRGGFVWIDIEESHYVDGTLDVFRRARAGSDRVGLCLQAYLHRTPADIDALAPLAPAIRLVKGAYREPPAIAFARKADTDDAYLRLGGRLLELAAAGRARVVFGTHDQRMIDAVRARASALGVPADRWEVHMLYGIRADAQRRLAADGVRVRVLISYGTHWFPWYMRRLAERPANVWFVVRNLFG